MYPGTVEYQLSVKIHGLLFHFLFLLICNQGKCTKDSNTSWQLVLILRSLQLR